MVVRSSMSDILARVRLLVNDTGGTPIFTDQEIQDTCDTRRTDVRYLELTPAETIAGPPTAGTVTWLDYYAPVGWWENDESLVSNVFAPLTPATSDRIVGHWTLSVSQIPPVYIVGKTYDLYAAAADTLDQWIAMRKLEYDFDEAKDRFFRSQSVTQMQALAASYRAKSRPRSVQLGRPDTYPQSPVGWLERSFESR